MWVLPRLPTRHRCSASSPSQLQLAGRNRLPPQFQPQHQHQPQLVGPARPAAKRIMAENSARTAEPPSRLRRRCGPARPADSRRTRENSARIVALNGQRAQNLVRCALTAVGRENSQLNSVRNAVKSYSNYKRRKMGASRMAAGAHFEEKRRCMRCADGHL